MSDNCCVGLTSLPPWEGLHFGVLHRAFKHGGSWAKDHQQTAVMEEQAWLLLAPCSTEGGVCCLSQVSCALFWCCDDGLVILLWETLSTEGTSFDGQVRRLKCCSPEHTGLLHGPHTWALWRGTDLLQRVLCGAAAEAVLQEMLRPPLLGCPKGL